MLRWLKNLYLKYNFLFDKNLKIYKNNYNFSAKVYFFLIFIALSIFLYSLHNKITLVEKLKNGFSFEAIITNQYENTLKDPKKNSSTFVIQDNSGNIFRLKSSGIFKNLKGRKILVYGRSNCNLMQLLKKCNLYGATFSIIRENKLSNYLEKKIYSQHNVDYSRPTEYIVNTSKEDILREYLARDSYEDFNYAANLYSALFLGKVLDKKLRDAVSALGLAHVIAISGMHLAIISATLLIIFAPIYKALHKYFPFRNARFDISLIIFVCLFLYLYLIDFQPSFLRAFVMCTIGFLLSFYGFKIVNFFNLLMCALFILAFNPNLFFNAGFTLSVSGVFYIFLYLRHFRFNNFLKDTMLLSIIIYFQMMIIVHFFFPIFSPFQLLSIPISIIFTLIFPFLVFLHFINMGDIFDSLINITVAYPFPFNKIYSSPYLLAGFVLLSIAAIFSKKLYLISILISIIFFMISLLIFFNLIQFNGNFLIKMG